MQVTPAPFLSENKKRPRRGREHRDRAPMFSASTVDARPVGCYPAKRKQAWRSPLGVGRGRRGAGGVTLP
jgi:hypothetical protein